MTLELLIGAFGNQFVKNYLLPSFFRPSVRPSVHVRILPLGNIATATGRIFLKFRVLNSY